MTATPQLSLLVVQPRRTEPGEPYCCLDCGRHDSRGAYGPPGLEETRLRDGSAYTIDTWDVWFCRTHSIGRWGWYRCPERRKAVAKRRRRLRAFRVAASRGHRGLDKLGVAEDLLRRGDV